MMDKMYQQVCLIGMLLLTCPYAVCGQGDGDWDHKSLCDSFQSCQILANQGDADAQYLTAVYFREGIETLQDTKEAIRWLTEATQNNHTEATLELALYHSDPTSDTHDHKKAFSLFQKAKKLGSIDAYYHLGLSYLKGHGTKANPQKALSLLTYAAERQDDRAQWELAMCYEQGIGTESDIIQAFAWLNLAHYNSDDEHITRKKEQIFKQLSRLEQARASTMAALFMTRYGNRQFG